MNDYNKERIRYLQINLDKQIDLVRNRLEETKWVHDQEWKEIDKLLSELHLTSGKIKDEIN